MGMSLVALYCEPFDTGRLVVGHPEVVALANYGGQSIAEVILWIEGAALIQDESDFARRLVCPGPPGHVGSPHRLPGCSSVCAGLVAKTVLNRGGRSSIFDSILWRDSVARAAYWGDARFSVGSRPPVAATAANFFEAVERADSSWMRPRLAAATADRLQASSGIRKI
jgi:hypothetical protein